MVEVASPGAERRSGPGAGVQALGVLAIAAVGLAIRLYWVLKLHPPGDFVFSDMNSYVERAHSLLARKYDAFDWIYPPGTSVWLAAAMRLAPRSWATLAAVMQAAISTLEVPLVFWIGKRWFGARVGLVSCLCFALHPFSIDYCGLFLSENYVTLWLIVCVALFDPASVMRSGLSGLALGMAALVKPQSVLLAPLWMGLMLLHGRRWTVVAMALGLSLTVMPTSYFASKATGHFQVGSAASGEVLTQAWCPIRDVVSQGPGWSLGFGLPTVWMRVIRGEQEATWGRGIFTEQLTDSKFFTRVALGCIKRFPAHAARTLVLNVWDTFAGPPYSVQGPWPDAFTGFHAPILGSNLAFCWLVVPVALFAMIKFRRDPAMLYVTTLPLVSCVLSCMLFHGEPRFRIPYDAFLWIAFCAGTARWLASRSTQVQLPAMVPGATTVAAVLALGGTWAVGPAHAQPPARPPPLGRPRLVPQVQAPAVLPASTSVVVLWESGTLGGRHLDLHQSAANFFADNFNDVPRSLQVRVGQKATFFEHTDAQGAWFTYNCSAPIGDYPEGEFCDLPDVGAKVTTSWTCVFREPGKRGCQGWWNDRISSVRLDGPADEHQPQGVVASGMPWER
jgi:hypothetical protein